MRSLTEARARFMFSAPLVRLPCSTTVRNNRISVKSKRNSFPSTLPKSPIGNDQLWRLAGERTLLHGMLYSPIYGVKTRDWRGDALMRARFARRFVTPDVRGCHRFDRSLQGQHRPVE